jgi:hypothetical protein
MGYALYSVVLQIFLQAKPFQKLQTFGKVFHIERVNLLGTLYFVKYL